MKPEPPTSNAQGERVSASHDRRPPAVAVDARREPQKTSDLDARDLLLLHRISQLILQDLDAGAMARSVTVALEELFGERRAASVVVREAEGLLCLAHTRFGLDGKPSQPGAAAAVTRLLRDRPGGGIIDWVISNARPVRLADTAIDERYLMHDPRVRSELCVPIPGAGATIGAINVESALPDAFSAREETVLCAVGNQLGAALDNARLYQSVRHELAERRAMHQALRDSERRYRTLFEHNPHPMWVYDRATFSFLAVNDAAVSHYGYTRDAFLHMSLRDILPADDVVRLEPHGDDASAAAPRLWRHRLKNGRIIHVEVTADDVDFDGHDARLVLAHDVSERLAAQAQQRLHAAVVESTRDGIAVTGLDGRVLSVNRALTRITGHAESELVERRMDTLLEAPEGDPAGAPLLDALARDGHWQGECRIRRRDGATVPTWLTLSTVHDDGGRETHRVGTFTDISPLKASQAETERLASQDLLTGLPNRRQITRYLERSLARASRHGWHVVVLYVDLDRFKNVNDSFGHAAGDELLRVVAGRLAARLRQGDSIGRLGGDEFLVVLESVDGPGDAASLAAELLTLLDEDVSLEAGQRVHVGASIGISMYPQDGADAGELVRNADAAMYLAKEQGRHAFRFYSEALTTAAQARQALEMRLRAAVASDAFTLAYQPILTMDGSRVLGAEALLRWTDTDGTPVSPALFVPVAEETGLMLPLGDRVLHMALGQLRRWLDSGLCVDVLAINVSVRQLERGDLVETLQQMLAAFRIDPARIELEITESSLMRQARKVEDCVQALKALGVRLAIDDFGTGYSSLLHLKRFPVDKLKIDRSFVTDIPGDGADLQIATAVISMAHSLELEVVAEGVETDEQRRILERRGCDAYQGYLTSPAIPAEDFARRFLRARR